MKSLIIILVFISLKAISSEITQDWYLSKIKYEYHIHNKILISSNCLYSKKNCLAGESIKNAKNIDLNGKYTEGGKNPLYMICLLSNGTPKSLIRENTYKKFCFFEDNSSVSLDDLYEASFD